MDNKETKHDKFKRLARTRGNRILRDLDLLGNLANRSNYEYEEEDVRKIFSALDEQLKLTKARFARGELKRRREIEL